MSELLGWAQTIATRLICIITGWYTYETSKLRAIRTLALMGALMLSACVVGEDTAADTEVSQAQAGWKSALAVVSRPGVGASAVSNFEVGQVHPLDLTPDGRQLLSVNTANGTLEVFNVTGATVTLTRAIKVGMDPVTVRAASNTEAWVVNVLSDSISIVDLVTGTVKSTLATDDEPADVVFAGSPRRAYVSCAQARTLMVFDAAAPSTVLSRIPVLGQQPRALATSADGSKVYLAIFESGNGTIALTGKNNSFEPNILQDPTGPYGGVNPPPNANNATTFSPALNPSNPAPSNQVSLIVRRTDAADWLDDNGRSWKRFVSGGIAFSRTSGVRVAGWDLIDRDVAIIDTATQAVTYQGGMLNIVMGLAVNPASGQISVVGTDAINQVRFEPNLNGRFLRVMFGGFLPGQANSVTDLNSHLSYLSSTVAVSERNKSIGDPRGIVWNAAGTHAYVTGLGSNNLIVLDAQGNRAGRAPTIEVGQGPTGIVLQEAQRRAFVLNRFDATISVVNLDTELQTEVVGLSYDPTPQVVRDGRPMLYDTHRFSGLGHASCASCHVDGKTDRLAWDLGDPAGAMATTTGADGVTRQHHPMKGPLLTQTLVDTMQSFLLHWRGDKLDLGHFAGAFSSLQGSDAPATAAEIASMKAFLETLRTPPNPYRNLDNSYPTVLNIPGPTGTVIRTGNAALGAAEFESTCRSCHHGNTGRGNILRFSASFSGGQFLLPPRWQNFYRRDGLWFRDATNSTAGFGFQQDGTFDSAHNGSRSNNMMAFMYSFNGSFPYTPAGLDANSVAVDAHAAVGKQVTPTASTVSNPRLTEFLALADQAVVGMVASGCINNETRGYVYAGNGVFNADRAAETVTLGDLIAQTNAGSPITYTVVRQGTQTRSGIDQDGDGTLDGAQGATAERSCISGQGNLLLNGSFETNSVPALSWRNLPSLTGWQATGGIEVWRNLNGWPAANGSSWIELDATPSTVNAVSQRITALAGDRLVLRFAYSARPHVGAQSNTFHVRWNGTVIGTLSPDGTAITAPDWKLATFTVTATGNDTLEFLEAGLNDGLGGLIDTVSLVSESGVP